MAILDMSKREPSSPSTPQRAKKSLFSFAKTTSSLSSFSSHNIIPPHKPSLTFSRSIMEEHIDNASTIIKKWDHKESSYEKFTSLFQEDRKEAKAYIQCVKDLKKAMHFFVTQHSTCNKLVLAQNLMQKAMKRLENEFYQILSTKKDHLDPESISKSNRSSHISRSISIDSEQSTDLGNGFSTIQHTGAESISEAERVSFLTMCDLKMIADCMISSGYAKECWKIYRIIRKSVVDEGLYRLGIESRSSAYVNAMKQNVLEDQIKHWIDSAKIAVRTLFYGERLLCDHVFSNSKTINETCFGDVAREGGIVLLKLPEIVAKTKKSHEKIFLFMDLYEAIAELLPEIESIFSFDSISSVKVQAISSLNKLKISVLNILSDFELSIQRNSSKTPVSGGGIHPLTISVSDYLASLASYNGVLSDIISESTSTKFSETYFESKLISETSEISSVSGKMAWIVLVLLCKLDSKAELYNDIALSYLFLANNIQFIIERVRGSILSIILGEEWILNLERKVKLYIVKYENVAWNKVFMCLPQSLDPTISSDTIKEHFKRFNESFEATYQKQKLWVVPDGTLRDEIKVSIARKLVPFYRYFYEYYMVVLSGEKDLEVLVRFSPDNIGNCLSDLFHENVRSRSLILSSSTSLPNSCVWQCIS